MADSVSEASILLNNPALPAAAANNNAEDQLQDTPRKNYRKRTLLIQGITVTVFLVLLVAALIVASLYVAELSQCDYNIDETTLRLVYTNCTRLITNSSNGEFCGKPMTVMILNGGKQVVHIYDVDCDALKWYNNSFNLPHRQTEQNVTLPVTLFQEYMAVGSQVKLTVNITVRDKVENEVHVCLFDDGNYYLTKFYKNPNWQSATGKAICKSGIVSNKTFLWEQTVPISRTTYYFIGIVGTLKIDSIQWVYQGKNRVLHHENYKDFELTPCTISNECTPEKQCVLAYAEPTTTGESGFSSVKIVPHADSAIKKPGAGDIAVVFLAVLFVLAMVGVIIYIIAKK